MPVYEYKCHQCGFHFDELRSINNKDTEAACPKCKGTNTKRLISAFGIGGKENRECTGSSKPCGGG